MKLLDVCLVEYLPVYDNPDTVEEWQWIEKNASYAHTDNGNCGVWEFIINTSQYLEFHDIPESLQPFFKLAEAQDYQYILFHQGT